ncbi:MULTISPECIES: hypothetical protein [Nitratiruptor]|uniref:Leucine rich repeat variant n=1 Tax=Nitratiruptor tergarcus DSM 16512 TaxID=1069081 RepID=A0A1W1WSE0_9BACT|nr:MULTISPECIES: hypothetical protein [Nitratiruptor]BCD63116.1 hypothetical protein NitYY0813_C2004 [Nitratiruptor sp. YY08-13]BCD67051.1 hypothetical protein NitYY0826_C2006 [Nitratiruptor sp. YY08-26]SMC08633.1 hypothetical protein SAMN05660197_0390 [Nitratiruptor tergarcus DSM 16512]
MQREEALELLEDKNLSLERVKEIFEEFHNDMEIVGMVAMNLSLRTSVYDREKGKSPIMTELLIALSEVPDMGSRWAVAKNPHTPAEILEKLAKDSVNLVRALVATNPNTPTTCLYTFMQDEKIVRDGISGNPNAPQEILEELAKDTDKLVRLRVAENPATPKEILQKLADDVDKDVSKAAQLRLEKLA